MATERQRRILFIDQSKQKYKDTVGQLEIAGFDCHYVDDLNNIVFEIQQRKPDVVVMNLIVQGTSMIPKIREIVQNHGKNNIKIIIVTALRSKENITECIRAGASDFIVEPFETPFLLERIKYQLQEKESFSDESFEKQSGDIVQGFQLIYDCLRVLSEQADGHIALHECAKRTAVLAKSPRANIIVGDLESNVGHVIAGSDDAQLKNKKIDLEKYQEVRGVLLNSNIVYIKDVSANPLTKNIQENVKTIQIQSLILFPIRHRQECIGALVVRMDQNSSKEVAEKHMRTFFSIALALAPKVAAQRMLLKYH